MTRKKTTHQKRLKEIRDKKSVTESRFHSKPFSLWDFITTYQMELLVAVILVGVVVVIPKWDSFVEKKDVAQDTSAISEDIKQQLLWQYPNGFKLIEIKNGQIISWDDTLPVDWEVEWGNLRIIRMDAERIRLKMPNVYYKPTRSILTTPTIDLQRRHQEVVRVNQLTGITLLAQLLEDSGDRVLCLFSFEAAP